MPELKDFLNSINVTKENLMETENPEENLLAIKQYNPFVINRFMAGSMDTVLLANQMNMRPNMAKKSQYEWFLATVRQRKRYAPWLKPVVDDNLSAVMEYFNCSDSKGREYLNILTQDEISFIHNKTNKGGRQ